MADREGIIRSFQEVKHPGRHCACRGVFMDNSGLAYTGVVGITTILRLTSETL